MLFGDHQYILEMPSMKEKCALFSGAEQTLCCLVQKSKGITEIQRYHSAIKNILDLISAMLVFKEIIVHVVIP